MRHLPSLVSLSLCAASATVVLYWGIQDKQGQFQAKILQSDPGMLLFFAGPYLILAAAVIVSWGQQPMFLASLIVTLVLSAVGVAAVGSDHFTSLRTPPGREVIPMLGFLATLLLWLFSVVLLLAVAAARLNRRVERQQKIQPTQ